MSTVGQRERLTQQRIVSLFRDVLGYRYQGNWEERSAIPPLIATWEPKLGVEVAEWGIKHMKTKWGTCTIEARRIWINLELAKKSERCLEYIVVHEMMHLLKRQHNDHFLELMNHFMPQWRQLREELNRAPLAHEEWEY